MLGRGNNFLLPNILADDKKKVVTVVFITEIEEGFAAIDVEALDGRIEVNEPYGNTADAWYRKAKFVTGVFDQSTLLDRDIQWIGKNIDRIEADLPGLLEAEFGAFACLGEGGVDEAEFHGELLGV